MVCGHLCSRELFSQEMFEILANIACFSPVTCIRSQDGHFALDFAVSQMFSCVDRAFFDAPKVSLLFSAVSSLTDTVSTLESSAVFTTVTAYNAFPRQL